jgi:DNA invertase Pin-like site-specific DNA recombinase
MSTEHQQYSTENQLDRIKEYAARRGMEIVRVFADEGKKWPEYERPGESPANDRRG